MFNLSTVELVQPRQWKGTVDKDVMIERIKTSLDLSEMKNVCLPKAKGLHHNVWDAIGIGLWASGRLSAKRVFEMVPE
jgi:hypothetical protein